MPTTRRRGARTYRPTPRNLAVLAARLREGELVAAPTETVYGLAADALNPAACRAIFRAKGRPASDPLIVHIYSVHDLQEICVPNSEALALAKAFWPGPLTMVLPKRASVPAIVTAGKNSVAVRMPRHPLFRRLLKLAGRPLAAPSANPFGYISPTSAEHVRENLGKKIPHILDGGPCEIGLESTIVDLRDPGKPRLLRPGAISAGEIAQVLGRPVPVRRRSRGPTKESPQLAPGLLARHYSPRTPVLLHDAIAAPATDSQSEEAYVYMRKPAGRTARNAFWFDDRGNLGGVAHRLYAVLRSIDNKRFKRIHVELAQGDGLADAINDRLRRAAAR